MYKDRELSLLIHIRYCEKGEKVFLNFVLDAHSRTDIYYSAD